MTASDLPPWFVVRPGAQRKGNLIKVPSRYTGSEILAGAEVHVFGEHITGVSSEGGGTFRHFAELGDLVSGSEFWLTIRTDGEPGGLAFTLDLVANETHLRKLTVEAPEPVSAPIVTERPRGWSRESERNRQ